MKSKLVKIGIALCVVVVLIVCFVYYRKNSSTGQLKEIAESYGLKNISVSINGTDSGTGIKLATINCSNLDSLSIEEMYDFATACSYGVSGVWVEYYKQGTDTYQIFPETLSISKNGEDIHNDYYNSNSHQNAVENEGKENWIKVSDDSDEFKKCWILAKESVKNNLKSPSSADFPLLYDEVSIRKSGRTYIVESWVEADNSFGAHIKNEFTVTIEKDSISDSADFSVISCVIHE